MPENVADQYLLYYILLKELAQELAREGLCNQVVWGGCVGGLCNLICSRENKENTGAAFGRAPQGRCAPLWLCFL